MSDPLSVAASITGLIALAGQIYIALDSFISNVRDAPLLAGTIQAEVKSFRNSLNAIDGLIRDPAFCKSRRAALISADYVVVSFTDAVLVFSQLEANVLPLTRFSEFGVVARTQWTRKKGKLNELVGRLQWMKHNLVLQLNILQCTSDIEAERNRQVLDTLITEKLSKDRDMERRLELVERQLQMTNASVCDGASIISSRTTDSAVTLRPSDSNDSRTTLTSTSSFQHAFEELLNSSWVYRRNQNREEDMSMRSSVLRMSAWSMLSDMSLANISIIAVMALPVQIQELWNGGWYTTNSRASNVVVEQAMEAPNASGTTIEQEDEDLDLDALIAAAAGIRNPNRKVSEVGRAEMKKAMLKEERDLATLQDRKERQQASKRISDVSKRPRKHAPAASGSQVPPPRSILKNSGTLPVTQVVRRQDEPGTTSSPDIPEVGVEEYDTDNDFDTSWSNEGDSSPKRPAKTAPEDINTGSSKMKKVPRSPIAATEREIERMKREDQGWPDCSAMLLGHAPPPNKSPPISNEIPPDQFKAMLEEARRVGQEHVSSSQAAEEQKKTLEDMEKLRHALDLEEDVDVVFPCKGCGEIMEEGKAFELAGNRWHIECFVCNTCGCQLDSDANLLLLGDGSLICNNCTYNCSGCGEKIEDLAILTGDQAFCAKCFRCRNCKRRIEDLRYARTSQDMFCMDCHEALMARRRKKAKAANALTETAAEENSSSTPTSKEAGGRSSPKMTEEPLKRHMDGDLAPPSSPVAASSKPRAMPWIPTAQLASMEWKAGDQVKQSSTDVSWKPRRV